MYPDETMETGAGFPALVRFEKNDAGAPLFARIDYGYPEGRPSDFLCHWLKEAGYSTLALTYPLGVSPFAEAWPTFTVTDRAEQSAAIIARYRQIDGLSTKLVVLAWSMERCAGTASTSCSSLRWLHLPGCPICFPASPLLRPTPRVSRE